jgi:NitT/TauT family transport system substrate-binding protein
VNSFLKRVVCATAVAASALALAACGDDEGESSEPTPSSAESTELTPVKLQLQWFTQAQFAGYFAAVDQGFYEDAGLDVEILEGGTDIVPQTQLAQGQADYAIAWVPEGAAVARAGRRYHDVGQVFQRSGTLPGLLQGEEHQHGGGPEGQEGRQLGLRQRVRAASRA